VQIKNSLFTILSFLLLFLGYFLGKANTPLLKLDFTESRLQGNYQFINPLLECESTSFSQNVALDSLKKQITDTVDQLKNTHQISFASVYFRDLNEGPWIGINEKEDFSPASLVKVPLMITYFKASETNPNILKQIIPLSPDYINKQAILPMVTLNPHQSYTVEELITHMIVYSDNQAYELLQNNIDNQLLINTYTDLGIDITKALNDPNGNIISVKSYAAFFRILFNASYLNRDLSEKALKLLSQIKYTDALIKGINNSQIIVSHKFGERTFTDTGEKQLHDCGIVYIPQKPYLICIMTRGDDFTKLSSSIAQISKTIYQFPR
jgi:beta-lactamase class A